MLHDPRCNPEEGCVETCEIQPLPMVTDPRSVGREAPVELAPWQDVTAGDETVWPPLGTIGPFTIENPNAVVYPERIAASQGRARSLLDPGIPGMREETDAEIAGTNQARDERCLRRREVSLLGIPVPAAARPGVGGGSPPDRRDQLCGSGRAGGRICRVLVHTSKG